MEFDLSEALRYLGVREPTAEQYAQVQAVAAEMGDLEPRTAYRILPVQADDGGIRLGELLLPGRSAARWLAGCTRAAVLICTLGFAFEDRLRTWQSRRISDAVILDACGSALVEAGCDAAEKEIAALTGGELRRRFSPGYGDLPLSLQGDICRLLNAEKHLGVHLTDGMLFNPTKTVSAVAGIAPKEEIH